VRIVIVSGIVQGVKLIIGAIKKLTGKEDKKG